jgi:hypothetical protein
MDGAFFEAALIVILIPYSLVVLGLLWNEIGPSIRTLGSWWKW